MNAIMRKREKGVVKEWDQFLILRQLIGCSCNDYYYDNLQSEWIKKIEFEILERSTFSIDLDRNVRMPHHHRPQRVLDDCDHPAR